MSAPATTPALAGQVTTTVLLPEHDPLTLAGALAHSCRDSTYFLYEDGSGRLRLASGRRAELIVTPDRIDLHVGDHHDGTGWTGSPLPHVHASLGALPWHEWRAYGWVSYELAHSLSGGTPAPSRQPMIHLVVPEVEVCFTAGEATITGPDDETVDHFHRLLVTASPLPGTGAPALVPVDVTATGRAEYEDAVAAAVASIGQGRLRKVILSRLVELEQDVDLVATYLTGRRANNPARSFLFRLGDLEATGFSPETVVEVSADGTVITQPLAGTRALTGDTTEDGRLRTELLGDPKEVYEHAISVQVAWDEMARFCVPGSIQVEDFMNVADRGSVQHIASRVTGRLANPEAGPWQAFAELFPAVTASGVPKKAACEVIRELESGPRDLYAGAVVTLTSDGDLDAALALRTLFRTGDRTWLRAGAGIVGQSRPEREFEETCEKLRSVSRHVAAHRPHHRGVVMPSTQDSPQDFIIASLRELQDPAAQITGDTALGAEGLDIDSIVLLALENRIATTFDVDLEDDEVEAIPQMTVARLAALVDEHRKG